MLTLSLGGESIEELIVAGCVLHVEFVPHVCSSLSVVEVEARKSG